MNIQAGDLFIIKGRKEDSTILVLEKEQPLPLYKQHYKVIIYFPDGNTKIQSLDSDSIEHYVITKQFIHYPVIK